MINLLPYENKQEIKAARTNVILVRYISILLVAAVVLGGLVAGCYVVLNATRLDAQSKAAENTQRVSQFQDIKTQSDAFRADLATAKTILDNDTSFSKLIYEIADTVPAGVVLDELTLDPQTFGSTITLNASAKTFDSATNLKDALIKNDKTFSNVQLQAIRSSESGDTAGGYPVQVTLSVVINKEAIQ